MLQGLRTMYHGARSRQVQLPRVGLRHARQLRAEPRVSLAKDCAAVDQFFDCTSHISLFETGSPAPLKRNPAMA
jgi:hypothetical protein